MGGYLTGKMAYWRDSFSMFRTKIETFSIDVIRTLPQGASSTSTVVSDDFEVSLFLWRSVWVRCYSMGVDLTCQMAILRGFLRQIPQKTETFSIDVIRTLLQGASSTSTDVSDLHVLVFFGRNVGKLRGWKSLLFVFVLFEAASSCGSWGWGYKSRSGHI